MQMEGMVAIVTGASRGLGRAIAEAYAKEGSKVVVTARPRSPTGLSGTAEQTAQDIQEAGGEAFAVPCDMGEEDQVRSMTRQVMDRYGKIDVLVNNAGIMIPSRAFPGHWSRPVGWAVGGERARALPRLPARGTRHDAPASGQHRQYRLPGGGRSPCRRHRVQQQQGGSAHVQHLSGRRTAGTQHRRQHPEPGFDEKRGIFGNSLGTA